LVGSEMCIRDRELKLPVDQSENIAGAAVRIRNDVGVAISANSSEYVGLSASTESGTAIVAQSTTGWAGNFIGPLHTSARLAINYASPTTFKIACNGDAAKPGGGSWSVLSDARLKRNIQPLHGALDRVLGLRGVTFEYTDEAAERGLALPGEQIGLIAQEVEKVFPDWVGQDEDGTKYVTEHGTTALFVEALRELRNEKGLGGAEALEQLGRQAAEIEELKRQVAELKQMLGQAAR
ncbi:MAG: tail fiber domain-containing protein, partial [Candidatus Eisenbacteria bacterium]|nr:tail fiber domain-containing protein [Candidatus Eisenbacteria bacterium]